MEQFKNLITKLNHIVFGLITGLILPLMIFYFLYYTRFKSIQYIEFPVRMIVGKLLPVIISWCVIPDLLLFFIFNWIDWMKAAKGVLIISVILTVALFALKLFVN